MDFIDSIQLSLSKYFDIKGNADRKEFWYFFIFYVLGVLASVGVDIMAGSFYHIPSEIFYQINIGIFSGVFIALTTIPFITVTLRRLNDAGFSKLFILLIVIPFGNFVVLFLCTKKSKVS